jgi:hypothetical protein
MEAAQQIQQLDAALAQLSAEEKLYFGSVAVSFAAVGGASFAYLSDESFTEGQLDDETRTRSLQRLQPAAYLGAAYSNLILPAIPAVDVVRAQDTSGKGVLPSLCMWTLTV